MRPAATVLRTFHHGEFDVAALVEAKGAERVSVCLPARDEAATVGEIVARIGDDLVTAGLVDEVLVVDDHSEDATATVAREAGARVVRAADVLAGFGEGHGKGEALWKSLYEAEGDLIVWCDADLVDFQPSFVVGLLGPLLRRPDIGFVKGFYDRPSSEPGDRGGRVTELVARPILSLLFPHLTAMVQPLAGEYAGRRALLEQLPFVEGYGVDLALVIDVAARFGTEAIAQVDLGVRHHRNRPLDELSPQAAAILQIALRRAGSTVGIEPATLVRPTLDPVPIDPAERPPLVSVAAYRRRSA
ncbi:MAG: glucosyl-3-phosphoglycerate synthase [Acidimicrobiales bacterium]